MRPWLMILAVLSGAGLTSPGSTARPAPQQMLAAGCSASDGDTLRCPGLPRIRLLGVDAAELPGHCAPGRDCAPGDPYAHRAALQDFVKAGPLRIDPVTTDRYGRIVAVVSNARGQNASCRALHAGARYVRRWDAQGRIGRACAAEIVR